MRAPRANAKDGARWALLADTHIPADPHNEYRGFRPHDNLAKIAPDVVRYRPDGVIIDGDIARLQGLPTDYTAMQQLIAPITAQYAVAMTLGNHDDRKNFEAAFKDPANGERQSIRDKYVLVIEAQPVRFVLLDSLLFVNEVPGLLGKEQRTWLDTYLARATAKPTLLFVHHTLDDKDDAMLDADRFLRIAARHRMVKAVFYGRSHAYAFDNMEGVHLVNLPAVGYNFRDSEPVGWVEALFAPSGCDLKLNAIGGNMARNGTTVSLDWRG